jgi:hypothetical protein
MDMPCFFEAPPYALDARVRGLRLPDGDASVTR